MNKQKWIIIINVFRTIVFIFIVVSRIVRKNLNDKNQEASSQKFKQQISSRYGPDTIYQWKQLEKLNQKSPKRCGNNNKDEDNCPKKP